VPQDCYRNAASLLLLRPAPKEGGWEILLLHKPRKRDAWQLPQGGMEGSETPTECAVRELQEEAGLEGAEVLGTSTLIYQYDFPASYRRFRPDHVCGQKIHFVYGTIGRDAVVTVDNNEVNRFKWVTDDQLPRYIKRKEYLELAQNLYQEALAAVS
jgi:putative (di)nucleoside polyphosphate hydrolase